MRTILLAVTALMLAMPAMAKNVHELTPDDYKLAFHNLQKMKPTAFDQAKQCIAKWSAKNFDQIRYCVALAFDFDPADIGDESMEDFMRFMLVKSLADDAMAKCITERNASPPLTRQTWDYCLDNAGLPAK